jgi:1-acyl-sn-glycerol-3-phosphate acyltransferase
MIQYIRSILFYLCYGGTAAIAGLASLLLWMAPFHFRYNAIINWNHAMLWCARTITGISYTVTGLENIPTDQPYVVLCKHQSTWETVFTQVYFKPTSTILKRSLLFIPFFGWGLALLRPIAINREKPREALRHIHREGVSRLKEGINVLVFPEGTRMKAGGIGNYARGGAGIACSAGVPVLPVAHNAGFFWPAPGVLKRPGTINVVIGKPIPTEGRNSKDITLEVRDWIEGEIEKMPTAGSPAPP